MSENTSPAPISSLARCPRCGASGGHLTAEDRGVICLRSGAALAQKMIRVEFFCYACSYVFNIDVEQGFVGTVSGVFLSPAPAKETNDE